MNLVYLACPYSHADPLVRLRRFNAANRAAGRLLGEGHFVLSPISHTHPIAECCDLPKGWQFWENLDRAYLACCKAMFVLTLDGWLDSVGVQSEIKIAREMGIPINFMGEV